MARKNDVPMMHPDDPGDMLTDEQELQRKSLSESKPKVTLIGEDGNSFAILGRCNRAAAEAGWSKQRRNAFCTKAMSGDYNLLISTVVEHFDTDAGSL